MHSYTEIPLSELPPYAANFRVALQAVCESPAFKTSPKSCEFLRHVVHHALSGDTDELKERLIGMRLLGREATYDTGSDAGVRVRANDVRKRLAAFNTAQAESSGFTFDLPSGSYVPRFFTKATLSVDVCAEDETTKNKSAQYEVQVPLTLQHLAAPTVIALFLCIVCLRWQIAREHPFTTFWQSVFQGHSVSLYLPSEGSSHGGQLVAMNEIQTTAPLLNLAGQFHSELDLTGKVVPREGETVISIGPTDKSEPDAKTLQTLTADALLPDRRRFAIIDTAGGRRIFDRTTSKIYSVPGGAAALLTISNGSTRTIRIDGTDEGSINSLVKLLCERDTFPEGLADSLSDAVTTQAIFPMEPRSQPILFLDAPRSTQPNIGAAQ
jgi:hypothetical protein